MRRPAGARPMVPAAHFFPAHVAVRLKPPAGTPMVTGQGYVRFFDTFVQGGEPGAVAAP